MRTALLTALAVLAVTAQAEPAPAKAKGNDSFTRPSLAQYRLSFKLAVSGLKYESSFVMIDGEQTNYVDGGEDAHESAPGTKIVDYKKVGTIVNCLAVDNPNFKNRVRAQCQFEISGPVKSKSGAPALDQATFQLTSSFEAEKGKPLALVEGPGKLIEVTISDLK